MKAKVAISILRSCEQGSGYISILSAAAWDIADLIESQEREAALGRAVLARQGAIVTCGSNTFRSDLCSNIKRYDDGKCPEFEICRLRAGKEARV